MSLGLARPGRGRMSKEAHAAIREAEAKGVRFAEKGSAAPSTPEPVSIKVVEPKKVRDIGEKLTGYTKEGWSVGFDTCRRCHLHANYCTCPEGVMAPSIVVSLDPPGQA